MLVNFGELINDARGKINGVVYSKNKGGAYVRAKVTPSNPQTSFQSAARARLSNFSKLWASLTAAQRSEWENFGKSYGAMNPFGAKKPISGLSAYIRANTVLDQAGLAPLTTAPSDNVVSDFNSITVTVDASDNNISIVSLPDPMPVNHYVYVSATPVIPAGQSFVKNRFRFIGSEAVSTPNELDWPTSRLGTIAASDVVYIKVQVLCSTNAAITVGEIVKCTVVA